MKNSLGNTTIHTLDPDAMTFVSPNYLIHQDYRLAFITAVFTTFTFLLSLFLLLIFADDVKSDTNLKDNLNHGLLQYEHGGSIDEHSGSIDEHGGSIDEHGGSIDEVISKLQNNSKCLINWF